MTKSPPDREGIPNEDLLAEMAQLRDRLAEAEETLRAIASGEADALLLSGDGGQKVQLIGAGDRVYRQFFETVGEGVALVSAGGVIRCCSATLATTLRLPLDEIPGSDIRDHLFPEDREAIGSIVTDSGAGSYRQSVRLRTADGVAVPVYVSAMRLERPETEPLHCLVFIDQEEVISAETTLRDSEALYRELLAVAPIGIAVFCAGEIAFVNPAAIHLLGADSEDQLIGRPATEIFHPDSREAAGIRIAKLLAREIQSYSIEDTFLRSDDTPIDVEILATPIKYGGGPAAQVIFTDITERKTAASALEFRNILLSTQQEASIDAILVVDENGRILSYNQKFIEMWGIPATLVDAGEDAPVLDLVSEQVADRDGFLRLVRFLYEHPEETSNAEILLTDGRIIDRYSASMFGPAHRCLGRIWYFRDISDSKRGNAERERLMAAIEQAVETVIITDSNGMIQYVNPAFEAMTGYPRADALGRNPRILKSGDQDREFYQELWTTISSGETWRGIIVNKRRDGATFTVESTISPVLDPAGQIVNYVAVDHDVSAQRLMEERLRQSQKMETIGQLAGGIAHDFNNMLQVIINYAGMSLAIAEPGDRLHKYLLEILRAAKRSAEMTTQLLAFARKQAINPKILDLNETVASSQKMIQRLIGENIDLAWRPGRDPWMVKIDPTQLEQILTNLAVNARDAIGGVGQITFRTENVTIDEEYCTTHPGFVPGEYLLLAVNDDGCGMDTETRSRIFEPFFTTKDPGRGTGLGLATIYGIVKQNNGSLDVSSKPGEGSTFKVYLPRAEEEVGEDAAGVEPEFPRGGAETLLVVEDEEAILELIRESLGQLGYTILTAASPEEAIRRSEELPGPIDLLITDMVMPQMNGRELAEKLVAARPRLKCLYMSGYTADIIGHTTDPKQDVHFIAKPFPLSVLVEKVRSVIDGC